MTNKQDREGEGLVQVTIDGKPFELPPRCSMWDIYFKARDATGYLLGRERADGQVDDIKSSEIVEVSEGDRFVTFPGARYC